MIAVLRHYAISLLVSFLALVLAGCNRNAEDYLKSADSLASAGRHEDAVLGYRKALEKDPKLGAAYYGFAQSMLKLNRADEGYQALRRAAELLPQRTDIQVMLADVTLAAYQSDPANRMLYDIFTGTVESLLAKERSFDSLRLKGLHLLLERKPAEALEYFKSANAIKPWQDYVILAYTRTLILLNRGEEGEKLAREFLSRNKTFMPVYDLLYRHHMSGNRRPAAEEVLRELVRNNPNDVTAMVRLAGHFARIGDTAAMDRVLEEVVGKRATYQRAYEVVGDFRTVRGQLDKAAAAYEAGLSAEPGRAAEYQKRLARVRLSQGRFEDTLSLMAQILPKSPDDDEALGLKGDALLQRRTAQDLNEAVGIFNGLRKKNPGDGEVLLKLGQTHLAKNDLKSARASLQEAVRRSDRAIQPKLALAAVSLLEQKHEEALRYLEDVVKTAPMNPQARYLRVVTLLNSSRYDEARSDLNKLVKDYPNANDLQILQGVLAVASRRYAEAETIFASLGNQSDPRVVGGLAEAMVGRQQFDRALRLLQAETGKAPKSFAVRRLLAATAIKAGKYDTAITELQQLSQAFPTSVDVVTLLGNAFREKGELDEALKYFQKAAQMSPSSAQSKLLVGYTLQQAGKRAEAISTYRQALSSEPGNPILMNNLAYALAESGGQQEVEEALRLSQKAARMHPNESDFQDTLGFAYLKKGGATEAHKVFEELCRTSPKHVMYRYHLGLALLEKKDVAAAKEAFNIALSNKPSLEEARLIREALKQTGAQP